MKRNLIHWAIAVAFAATLLCGYGLVPAVGAAGGKSPRSTSRRNSTAQQQPAARDEASSRLHCSWTRRKEQRQQAAPVVPPTPQEEADFKAFRRCRRMMSISGFRWPKRFCRNIRRASIGRRCTRRWCRDIWRSRKCRR